MPKFHTASEAFVTRLYDQVLSREPGEAGLEAFSRSQEFLRRTTTDAQFLTILYHIFLSRKLDSPGFNAFLTDLQSGAFTRGNLLDIFLDSQEFAALAGFLPPPDPLTGFVTTLYARILGRGPDLACLQGGAVRCFGRRGSLTGHCNGPAELGSFGSRRRSARGIRRGDRGAWKRPRRHKGNEAS